MAFTDIGGAEPEECFLLAVRRLNISCGLAGRRNLLASYGVAALQCSAGEPGDNLLIILQFIFREGAGLEYTADQGAGRPVCAATANTPTQSGDFVKSCEFIECRIKSHIACVTDVRSQCSG